METLDNRQPFWAISKICLNNWHYIDRKILTLSEGINFFTGHSGSGKSTVIDAIQIVLYANTDGRGFFNKAAADDSDRTLIEYLRGMVNISENNESQYLRNKNFSSTIVIELEQTRTHEKQCVGVVFDVETATNEINRLFFWHRSGLLANAYRGEKRCLSTVEIREYLQRTFGEEAFYCGPSNERFRRQLYDVYLGGLDKEKFPRLFKRAIPFRMNIKLEEFVKEYICMEQDIQIEDLKESIMQYGRMRSKIESTMEEIEELKKIDGIYQDFDDKREKSRECDYRLTRLEMLRLQADIQGLHDKIKTREEGIKVQEHTKAELMRQSGELQKEHEELLLRLNNSGYKALEAELLADEKERSEHNMLVDLGRNDIGKISRIGTVEVEKYMSIERYSHVMHIGSTVRGVIREDADALDAVDAILPAGTLSGAPKLRACEIINELEDNKRGIYGGAIGYISFTGNLDTCIAIRLAFSKNGKVFVRSGAGIVADSVPEKEYRECIQKAAAVRQALQKAQEGMEA